MLLPRTRLARAQPLLAAGESGRDLLGCGDAEWFAVQAQPRVLRLLPRPAQAQAPVSLLGAIQLREPGRTLRRAR